MLSELHIIVHQHPLKPSDPSYKGSKFSIMIKWENVLVTFEPLIIIAADDPVTCAIYAKENGLRDLDGWKWFKGVDWPQQPTLRPSLS